MEFIEVIENYLATASLSELHKVDIIITERIKMVPTLQINEAFTKQAIMRKCTEMYDGSNKLVIVKFLKDMTGMGLKECKDWCDSNIFNKG